MDPNMSGDPASFGLDRDGWDMTRSLQHPMSLQEVIYNSSAQSMMTPVQYPACYDQNHRNHPQQRTSMNFSPCPHQLSAGYHEQQHYNSAGSHQQQQPYMYLNHQQQPATNLTHYRPTSMSAHSVSPRQNTAVPGYLAHTEASRARRLAALNQSEVNQLPRNHRRVATSALQSTVAPRQSHPLHEVSSSPPMSLLPKADSSVSPTPQPRRKMTRKPKPKKKMDIDKQSTAMTVTEKAVPDGDDLSVAELPNMTDLSGTVIKGPASTVVALKRPLKMPSPTTVGMPMQPPLFSVALSPTNLGYFGNLQFWDSVDEYLRHFQMVSHLHDQCKRFAAWIVNHDIRTSSLAYQDFMTQVDSIMQDLFHMEGTARYGNYEAFFNAPGRTMFRPESTLLQLDAEVTLCLMVDQRGARGLSPPNQASVMQLKQDSTHNQIRFHRANAQLLGLMLSMIVKGKRNDLIVCATQYQYLNIAKRLLGETEDALEAYHRGTASLQQRFYYQDEFKNAIAWGLGKTATRKCEGNAAEGVWLHTFVNLAIHYRVLLTEPKLSEGGILPIPALLETALYHVDQIIFHAHDEIARYNQAIRVQGLHLGKRTRSPEEEQPAQVDDDKDSATPSPKKVKTTKKSKPSDLSQTKSLYGDTQQSSSTADSKNDEDGLEPQDDEPNGDIAGLGSFSPATRDTMVAESIPAHDGFDDRLPSPQLADQDQRLSPSSKESKRTLAQADEQIEKEQSPAPKRQSMWDDTQDEAQKFPYGDPNNPFGEDSDQDNHTRVVASNFVEPLNGDETEEGDEVLVGDVDWDQWVYDFDPLSGDSFDAGHDAGAGSA